MEDYYVEHEVDVFAENDPDFEIDEATFDDLDDDEEYAKTNRLQPGSNHRPIYDGLKHSQ
jgi:hypothetical protein